MKVAPSACSHCYIILLRPPSCFRLFLHNGYRKPIIVVMWNGPVPTSWYSWYFTTHKQLYSNFKFASCFICLSTRSSYSCLRGSCKNRQLSTGSTYLILALYIICSSVGGQRFWRFARSSQTAVLIVSGFEKRGHLAQIMQIELLVWLECAI